VYGDKTPPNYAAEIPQTRQSCAPLIKRLSHPGKKQRQSNMLAPQLSGSKRLITPSIAPAACVSKNLISGTPATAGAECRFIAMLICAARRLYALATPA
jgi:hypothetical protein